MLVSRYDALDASEECDAVAAAAELNVMRPSVNAECNTHALLTRRVIFPVIIPWGSLPLPQNPSVPLDLTLFLRHPDGRAIRDTR